jgi:hypothetical protein
MLLPDLPPAFPEPPHLRFGSIASWFTHPAGSVVQFLEPTRATLPMANWLVGPGFDELMLRFPTQRLTLVLDLSLMLSRTSASRSVFLGKVRQVGARFGRGALISPRVLKPAAARSVEVSVALIRALGVDVAVFPTASAAIGEWGLRRAP